MKKKLQVIECAGSPYEIGRQYGEAAKENLQKAAEMVFRGMEHGFFKAARGQVIEAAQRYLNNVRAFDPEAEARIEGMAEGAGLTFGETFALQCNPELQVNYPALAGMCTAFALTGPATRDGMTIIGQNVDWSPGAPIDIARIRHADGSSRLCISLLGYGNFYLTSAGLGNCATLMLCPMGEVKGHVPFSVYMNAAMSRETQRDAMELLSRTARGIGYVHVADGEGNIAGVESVYDDYALLRPENGVIVHANHYETAKYKNSDFAKDYIPDSFQPRRPPPRADTGSPRLNHARSHDGHNEGPRRTSRFALPPR